MILAKCHATNSNEINMTKGFIKNGKKVWSEIESKNEKFFLSSFDIFDIPQSGALTIKSIWEMKGLLTKQNKDVIFDYFGTMVFYARMFEEILGEEAPQKKDSSSKGSVEKKR